MHSVISAKLFSRTGTFHRTSSQKGRGYHCRSLIKNGLFLKSNGNSINNNTIANTTKFQTHFFRNERFFATSKLHEIKELSKVVIQSGLEKGVIKEGDGKTFPASGQTVEVHYTGYLLADGTKFDSSKDHGETFKFQLGMGQVIPGWDLGVAKMSLGEQSRLYCSPQFAYGKRGVPPVIPPDATLIFDVELISID